MADKNDIDAVNLIQERNILPRAFLLLLSALAEL